MPNPVERPRVKSFREQIAKKFLIRFHMSLILAAVMASAVLCSKLLLNLGVYSLPIRYPIAALVAYLVFLGLVRIWVAYVTYNDSSQSDADLDVDLDDVEFPSVGPAKLIDFSGGSTSNSGVSHTSSSGGSSWSFDFDEGGWILIVLGILLAVIFGAGAYLIYIAPEMLPEVALQVVMASTLKRASHKLEAGGWAVSILKGTVVPFLIVFVLTIGLGVVVHHTCPMATKLTEAMNCPN